MKAWITALAPAAIVAVTLGVAIAKLPPAAPLDPAKAEEKKALDAAAVAATAAQQAKAEDRAVARYLHDQKAKGKVVTPQMAANAAEMDAKAREAAAKVAAAAAPAAHAMAGMAGAKPAMGKAEAPKK